MSRLNAYSQLLCLPCRKKLAHGNTAEAFEPQSSSGSGRLTNLKDMLYALIVMKLCLLPRKIEGP